ncbi:MAG: RNA polymerase sporulation sigma factor SigH [Coriobacteriia bacterium]
MSVGGETARRRPCRGHDGEFELIRAAQSGDQRACAQIFARYGSFVRGKARSYFIAGGERDDVVQEGMIGLFKAIRDFDCGRQTSFRSFAELCVTRQLISAIKAATRRKHAPLNGYVSLSRTQQAEDEGERLLSDILAARECDPADIVVAAWESRSIRDGFTSMLSPFETEVLRRYVEGRTYQQIAEDLGRHVKSVDNALQRTKRKVELQVERCRAC